MIDENVKVQKEFYLNEPATELQADIVSIMKDEDIKGMTVGYGVPAVMRRLISGKKHYDDIVYTLWDQYALQLLEFNAYVNGYQTILGHRQGIYLVTELGVDFWKQFLAARVNDSDSKVSDLII